MQQQHSQAGGTCARAAKRAVIKKRRKRRRSMTQVLARVKVVGRKTGLDRQTPQSRLWGGFRFDFDGGARDYDYLVVYDDIPGGLFDGKEILPQNARAILLTHEPAAVKIYGDDFAAQFSAVLTCHENWALSHACKIQTHPSSPWLYRTAATYEQMRDMPPPQKSKGVSTICSAKQMRHTLHARRLSFMRKVKDAAPEMDWFGRGVNPIREKEEALDDYRAHLVVENHICPGYWTEKLADAFLAWTLPVYCGAPDVADYFPEESFIAADVGDVDSAARAVRQAAREGEYERRLPAIAEARRRILEEHNFPALASRELANLANQSAPPSHSVVCCRRAMWRKSPAGRLRYLAAKARARMRLLRAQNNDARANV